MAIHKRLERRLDDLEGRIRIGCATCIGWSPCIYVTLDESGVEIGRTRPRICPDCGTEPFVRIERTIMLVGPDVP